LVKKSAAKQHIPVAGLNY